MNTTENHKQGRHEEIAQRARELWEREGRQAGHDAEYWLRAEREVLSNANRTGKASPNRGTAAKAEVQGTEQPAGGRPARPKVLHI